MKKLLLLITAICFSGVLFAQYAGTPFTGTPWQFGADSLANFSVGQELEWKNGNYHGIPHYAYDVGLNDSLSLPSDDLAGALVAGSLPSRTSTTVGTFPSSVPKSCPSLNPDR